VLVVPLASGCVQGGPGPVSAGGTGNAGGTPGSDGGSPNDGSGGSHSADGGTANGGTANGGTANGGTANGSGGAEGNGGSSNGGTGLGGSASGGAGTGGASNDPGVVLQGVRWIGRVEDVAAPRFAWSGSGFVAKITGTGLTATLSNDDGYFFQVVVDGSPLAQWAATPGEKSYTLASGLTPGSHVIELYRQTEGQNGNSALKSLEPLEGSLETPPNAPRGLIEIVGDSISAGYGNLGPDRNCPFTYDTESHYDTYGAVAARSLGVDLHTIAISGHGVTRNYDGATTDLLPDVYNRTLTNQASSSWDFPKEPTVIVVNLGTNDFATGDPGAPFEAAYGEFLADLRQQHPDAFLLATLGPMLTDTSLNQARAYITGAVEDFAAKDAASKIDFLEYAVRVESELGCDWHPNVMKHKSMGEALATKLQELGLF